MYKIDMQVLSHQQLTKIIHVAPLENIFKKPIFWHAKKTHDMTHNERNQVFGWMWRYVSGSYFGVVLHDVRWPAKVATTLCLQDQI